MQDELSVFKSFKDVIVSFIGNDSYNLFMICLLIILFYFRMKDFFNGNDKTNLETIHLKFDFLEKYAKQDNLDEKRKSEINDQMNALFDEASSYYQPMTEEEKKKKNTSKIWTVCLSSFLFLVIFVWSDAIRLSIKKFVYRISTDDYYEYLSVRAAWIIAIVSAILFIVLLLLRKWFQKNNDEDDE